MRVALLGAKSLGGSVLDGLLGMQGVDLVQIVHGGDERMVKAASRVAGVPTHIHWKHQAWATERVLEVAKPDVILAAHWTGFVTRAMRDTARHGVLAYHPSLLPRHRGIDSVEWTIRSGDRIAGGTVYQMDEGIDTGPIVMQEWCHVDERWTASDLWREQLFPMGRRLLCEVASRLVAAGGAGLMLRTQDERFATYEEKI